jgi:hypothetical protein
VLTQATCLHLFSHPTQLCPFAPLIVSSADALLTTVLFRVAFVGRDKNEITPRPALSRYYARMQQRPSWNAAFGTASSTWGKLSWILPAVIKANVFSAVGWY